MPEIESKCEMTEVTRLALIQLLPAVPHAQDGCIARLRDLLRAKHGIEDAHLLEGSDQKLGEICIHFDPAQLSIGEVRELAHRAGTELDLRYGHLMLKTETLGAREARTIEARIANIPGVLEAAVALTGEIRIEFDHQLTDVAQIVTTKPVLRSQKR
jgi:Cd2+/Zn2+-exporting ATPase